MEPEAEGKGGTQKILVTAGLRHPATGVHHQDGRPDTAAALRRTGRDHERCRHRIHPRTGGHAELHDDRGKVLPLPHRRHRRRPPWRSAAIGPVLLVPALLLVVENRGMAVNYLAVLTGFAPRGYEWLVITVFVGCVVVVLYVARRNGR
ncbi:hypothetical protein [Streptomyces sp. NPDC096105]|uniref:hypothetical protein n=1 Tax=Streptomyces sp. NPDC096105 TaxID=3366074 RepID=UPI003819AB39